MSEGELNLGLLCYIAYRATETRVFEALAAAGFDDITTCRGGCSPGSGRTVRG